MTPLFLAVALTAFAADGVHDVVFLAEGRPIYLRLKVTFDGRTLGESWPESAAAVFRSLDRDGDGKLTGPEADPAALAALARLADGGDAPANPTAAPTPAPDPNRVVTRDAFVESIRDQLGPFRIHASRPEGGRTDALFGHLDRDKDDQITRPELALIARSLRRLDLYDDDAISPAELEPFKAPAPMEAQAGSLAVAPVAVERTADESPLRLARLLMKTYDKGRPGGAGRPDGALSREEFAVDDDSFDQADLNKNGSVSSDELRRFLGRWGADLALDVDFPAEGEATVKPSDDGAPAEGVTVRALDDGGLEVAVGAIRLDVQLDDFREGPAEALRLLTGEFKVADANEDGYLEASELAARAGSRLTGLFAVIDRDADGKVYPAEFETFVELQAAAARGRLAASADDQGRALFGVLDADRDRRLGARELMNALERVSSWDADGDGSVSADEVPYHVQVRLRRGGLPGLSTTGQAVSLRKAGPAWFRKMDRNRDGDVSRREFLGPRDAFDRLDRDRDGLIDPAEAAEARPAAVRE